MVRPVRSVCVVGAGVVGLSTAWFLQELGVRVTVLEADRPGAGSSWGNAGWITPAKVSPLPEPGVFAGSVRGMFHRESPLRVQLPPDLGLLRFMARFAANSRPGPWERGVRALVPLARGATDALDELDFARELQTPANLLVAFTRSDDEERFVEEVESLRALGQQYDAQTVDRTVAAQTYPLSDAVVSAMEVRGPRYLDPRQLVTALADRVQDRGADILTGRRVAMAASVGDEARVRLETGEVLRSDAVVVATGAWIGRLAGRLGVTVPVQSGRGFSFTCRASQPLAGPVYFPGQRVACTPTAEGLRVAGLMEFAPPASPLRPERVASLAAITEPLMHGVDWAGRQDEWVGSRPCTADGLPLIGATRSDRVFLAGGHGMWGVTLSAVTGKNLAQLMVRGRSEIDLAAFSPMR